jgi:predicted SAM-dependent methyltransferase
VTRKVPQIRQLILFLWKPIGSWRFRKAYQQALQGDVKLHIGAGNHRILGWLNTDISPFSPLYLDATKKFPIKENSVSYIFSEHFIEHITRQKAQYFLNECFRVLKQGGIIRIATPDIENLSRVYLDNNEKVKLINERNKTHGYQFCLYSIDILNKEFLEDQHLCLYDANSLEKILVTIGFFNVTRQRIRESQHSTLSGIEQHDTGITDEFTLVVEAIKLNHVME